MSNSQHLLILSPRPRIPLAVKLLYTTFVAILVPLYAWHYGPANFLWFCDIAVLLTVPALWLESRFLASMQLTAVLLASLVWLTDFLIHLLTGSFPLHWTDYMFKEVMFKDELFKEVNPLFIRGLSLFIRGLSLFHGWLPFLLLWVVWRLGYDGRGWVAQSLLAWAVLPVCYFFADPRRGLNGVFGLNPNKPQEWMPPQLWLALLMLFYPLGVFFPTHLLLHRLFRRRPQSGLP
jgi:hypothetical protein